MLTNGVVVGLSAERGPQPQDISIVSEGSPAQMNYLVDDAAAQEQSTGVACDAVLDWFSGSLHCRFTAFAPSVGRSCDLQCASLDNFTGPFEQLTLRDCQLHGVNLTVYSGGGMGTIGLTNNLWSGGGMFFSFAGPYASLNVHLRNNLLWRAGLGLEGYTNDPPVMWTIRDNLFDGISPSVYDGGNWLAASHNGYTVGTTNTLGGSANQTELTVDYQPGPLGNYYLPADSSLLNAGSLTNAAQAGLFGGREWQRRIRRGRSGRLAGLLQRCAAQLPEH